MLNNIEEIMIQIKKEKVNYSMVYHIIFYYNQTRYVAEMYKNKIILSRMKNAGDDDNYKINARIAVHELKTGKTFWKIPHRCRNGRLVTCIYDKCYECNTSGHNIEATPENNSRLAVDGEYTPELAKIMPDEILAYSKKLEELLSGMKDS